MSEMHCERCQQQIKVGELYHQVMRHTDNYHEDPQYHTTMTDMFRVVHVDCKKVW